MYSQSSPRPEHESSTFGSVEGETQDFGESMSTEPDISARRRSMRRRSMNSSRPLMNTRDRVHDLLVAITIECTKHPYQISAGVKLRYRSKRPSFRWHDEN